MDYAELHCHSYYSFHDGASSQEELLLRARELGYRALAVTDHDNLCGAMCFANLSASLGFKGITGAEITVASSGFQSESHSVIPAQAGIQRRGGEPPVTGSLPDGRSRAECVIEDC